MVNLNFPTGVEARGKLALIFIPLEDVADINAITLAEVTGPSAVNASLHTMSDGWARSTTQATGARRRIGSDTSYQTLGDKTVSFDTSRFIYDPQNPSADVSKVYAALVEGNDYAVVERHGILGEVIPESGEYYDAYTVRVGAKDKMVPGDDGEHEFSAQLVSIAPVAKDKQIVGTAAPVTTWAATTPYATGDKVAVTGGTLQADNGGTSGATEPVLPGSVGGTVVDGDITWTRLT